MKIWKIDLKQTDLKVTSLKRKLYVFEYSLILLAEIFINNKQIFTMLARTVLKYHYGATKKKLIRIIY